LKSKDFSLLVDLGFKEDLLLGKKVLTAYQWIQEYVTTRGSWPTDSAVEFDCKVSLPGTVEDASYLVDLLKKRKLTIEISKTVEKVARNIDDNNPDEALADLLRFKLDATTGASGSVLSLKDTGIARVIAYDAKKAGSFEGILTPWAEINAAIEGFMDGTLTVILGMVNTGKTWLACVLANYALNQKKKILVVTMEMPSIRILRRLDSIRYKLPFGALRNADMDPSIKDRWKKQVEEDAKDLTSDLLVVDKTSVRTVTDVFRLTIQHAPDIVIIDGGYRFEGTQKSNWESTVSIVGDLQRYAELSKIPWVVTSQYGDADETGKAPKGKHTPKMRMWGARYGKEWVINPDVVLGLYAEAEDRALKQLHIYMLKIRDTDEDAMQEYLTIRWDLTSQSFESLGDPKATKPEEKIEVKFE
jgi:KaiC/GvpD/RAD55 family RecA-like ATPase